MVFSQFFSRFSSQKKAPKTRNEKPTKQKPNAKKKSARILLPSKDEHIRLTLQEAEKYAAQKKYKLAIQAINKGLNAGLPTPKLLNQKAHYLAESGIYAPAQEIWKKLKNDPDNPELAGDAAQSLKLCQQRQTALANQTRALLKYFHTLAKNKQQPLQFIPKPKDWKTNNDLTAIIAKEAEYLRGKGHAKLSQLIVDRALSEGFRSPTVLQQQALTLAVSGNLQDAKAILNNLLKNENTPKLKRGIQKSLQDLDAEQKQYSKNRSRHLLLRCSNYALANNWKPQHLPKPGAIKAKTSDSEAKKLTIQEIKSIMDAGKNKVALGMIDILFEFYNHAPQALQLKAKTLLDSNQIDSAIKALQPLLTSQNSSYATKALKLARHGITEKAKQLSEQQTADEAISFFINKHLQHGIAPEFNDQIGSILSKSSNEDTAIGDRELRQQELQLQFNSALIDHLEARLKKTA